MTKDKHGVDDNNAGSQQEKALQASGNPLKFTLAVQLLAVLPVSVVLGLINPLWLSSFVIGAFVYIVPNAYFTLYAFRFRSSEHSHLIVKSFYTGESGKHALAAVGFALVLKYVSPLHLPSLFAGFIYLVVMQWFIAYQISKKMN